MSARLSVSSTRVNVPLVNSAYDVGDALSNLKRSKLKDHVYSRKASTWNFDEGSGLQYLIAVNVKSHGHWKTKIPLTFASFDLEKSFGPKFWCPDKADFISCTITDF